MTMITPSYLGETIEYSSLHACRSTLEDPTTQIVVRQGPRRPVQQATILGDEIFPGRREADSAGARQHEVFRVEAVQVARDLAVHRRHCQRARPCADARRQGRREDVIGEIPAFGASPRAQSGNRTGMGDAEAVERVRCHSGAFDQTIGRARAPAFGSRNFTIGLAIALGKTGRIGTANINQRNGRNRLRAEVQIATSRGRKSTGCTDMTHSTRDEPSKRSSNPR